MRAGARVKLATSVTVMERTAMPMPSCMSASPSVKESVTGLLLGFSSPSGPPEESITHRTCTTHFVAAPGASQSSFSQEPPSPAETCRFLTEPSPRTSFSFAPRPERVLPKEKTFFSPAISSLLRCRRWSWTSFSSARASLLWGSSSRAASRSAFASPQSRWASSLFSEFRARRCFAIARRYSALTFLALIFNASDADFADSSMTFVCSGSSAGSEAPYLNCSMARLANRDSQRSRAALRWSSVCRSASGRNCGLCVRSRQNITAWYQESAALNVSSFL
mmetsp:Transcript_75712/g.198557  ORF Transcript_75712/g.198557 Transcript_75712/m.198557 type:complete len:279 (+) Transcript_75712:420-1256(+)